MNRIYFPLILIFLSIALSFSIGGYLYFYEHSKLKNCKIIETIHNQKLLICDSE